MMRNVIHDTNQTVRDRIEPLRWESPRMTFIFCHHLRTTFFSKRSEKVRPQTRDIPQLIECLPRVQEGLEVQVPRVQQGFEAQN